MTDDQLVDDQLVLGIFADEAAADAAVGALQAWAGNVPGISLGPIGVLVLDGRGQIKEHKLGSKRSTKKGAGIGLVLAVIAPPTLLVGVVGGGLLGHFHHKGLGLSVEDRDRIVAELTGGKAAVGVLVTADEVSLITDKFVELGGTAEVHVVTDEALEAVAAAAPGAADASPADPVKPQA